MTERVVEELQRDAEPAADFVPKAYVVFDLTITDAVAYEAYRLAGQASVREWNGRVLTGEPAPGEVVEAPEGDRPTERLVVLEFPSIEVARGWYTSDEYLAAAHERQASSVGRVLLVEGWRRPW